MFASNRHIVPVTFFLSDTLSFQDSMELLMAASDLHLSVSDQGILSPNPTVEPQEVSEVGNEEEFQGMEPESGYPESINFNEMEGEVLAVNCLHLGKKLYMERFFYKFIVSISSHDIHDIDTQMHRS